MSVTMNITELKRELLTRSISRADLARQAGISYSTLNAVFAGRSVSRRTWLAIAGVVYSHPIVHDLEAAGALLEKSGGEAA